MSLWPLASSGSAHRDIVTIGNELLVQFVSDLSVTSDGFMASYSSIPRGSREPTVGGDTGIGPNMESGPPKPKALPRPRPAPSTPKPPPPALPAPSTPKPPAVPVPDPDTPERPPPPRTRPGTPGGGRRVVVKNPPPKRNSE